jgi:class 3 adenylate cyclase
MEFQEEARLIQNEHEEDIRQKKKTRNIILVVGAFFLLLAGSFYFRWRYVRKSKATLQIEKDRSENLLHNILPAEIAQELKDKGKAAARDFDMVSILFTDFKSFTEQSAKLSAAELVNEINHCFEAFDGIIEKYGIEKIKTIGDAYMAAGGLPVLSDDSVKNTVLAALEMQAFVAKRKAENDAANKPAFEMRVGIHTGPVVAGIVGVKKFQYDIWGDTVNTASRIEHSGEVGKVNISQTTYELIKDHANFTFESRGKIEVKGKGEIEMYFVSKIQMNV